MSTRTNLTHAHAYAHAGWAVFPLKPNGKTPITRNGCKDATRDTTTITEWWTQTPNANIGIATGEASGIYVIDLDGQEGIRNWTALEERHGRTQTLTGITGSGGRHLIYLATGLPNTAGKLGGNIDTRGDGGYIVAPPSTHPNGRKYQWWTGTTTPAALPQWIRDRLTRHQRRGTAPAPVYTDKDTRYGIAALDRATTDIRGAADGTRNNTLNACAYSIGRLIAAGQLTERTAHDALLQAAVDTGLSTHEATNTIRSGLTAGDTNPAHQPTPTPAGVTHISYGFKPRTPGKGRRR